MDKIHFNGVKIEDFKYSSDYNISKFIPGRDIIEDEEFCLKLPKLDIIMDQTFYNSCVGHSFCLCKQILEYNLTGKWIKFDPYMIYGTRYEEDNYYGEGMYPHQGAKVLYKEGAFLRREFNFQAEMPRCKEVVDIYKENNPQKVLEAKDRRISGYSYCYSINDIKKALKNTMPVSAAYPLYDSFYNVKNDGKVPMPKKSESIIGYHQMTIVGWTKNNEWIVVNSWGSNYGLKGLYFIPFNYKCDSCIAVSDTITPIKNKAKNIMIEIGKSEYMVDDKWMKFDSIPYIKHSRTFVPIRFITEALGASVEWIQNDKKVIIRSEEALLEMKIGSKKYYIDGIEYNNDIAPEIINNRTMIPIRTISESLNCEVTWKNGFIIIKSL